MEPVAGGCQGCSAVDFNAACSNRFRSMSDINQPSGCLMAFANTARTVSRVCPRTPIDAFGWWFGPGGLPRLHTARLGSSGMCAPIRPVRMLCADVVLMPYRADTSCSVPGCCRTATITSSEYFVFRAVLCPILRGSFCRCNFGPFRWVIYTVALLTPYSSAMTRTGRVSERIASFWAVVIFVRWCVSPWRCRFFRTMSAALSASVPRNRCFGLTQPRLSHVWHTDRLRFRPLSGIAPFPSTHAIRWALVNTPRICTCP